MSSLDSTPHYRHGVLSRSPEETLALGERFGKAVKTPLVVGLVGGLGSGKTVFVQGMARGLGVPEGYYVTSPTYTLINEYPGRLPLVHIDLYRLVSEEDLETIGFYDLIGGPNVSAVEWADRVHGWEPREHLTICITGVGTLRRKIFFHAYGLDTCGLVKGISQTGQERIWD